MITIFCDFCQFSAKKMAFSQNQCYDEIFATTSSSSRKNANIFGKSFGENISKIILSVPSWELCNFCLSIRTLVITCIGLPLT
jgi:hypothetical protein